VNITENYRAKQLGAKPKPKGMHSFMIMIYVNLFYELVLQYSFKFPFFEVNSGYLKKEVDMLSIDALLC